MKKRLVKFASAVLSATMLLSSLTLFSTNAIDITETAENLKSTTDFFSKLPTFSTGDLTLSTEAPEDANVISSVDDYYNTAIANGADLQISAGDNSLPAKVDNSQSPYFPPIGNQENLGSCCAWAQVYYQFTYAMNKQRNVATNYSNCFSPKFTYNLVNGGWDSGATLFDIADSLKHNGSASMYAVPYDENCTSWSPTEYVWKDAIKAQLKDYQVFEEIGTNDSQITSVDDEDLLPIKTALANGEILTFSTYAYSFVVDYIEINASTPENTDLFNEVIISHLDGFEGPHRMAIVGYNDKIWYDHNHNNTVDQGEMGAFKIVNSWGEDYANNGFIWVAYDALNEDSSVTSEVEKRERIFQEVTRIDVHPYNYSGDFYLKAKLNTSARYNSQIYITAERNGSIKEATCVGNASGYGQANINYEGTTGYCDGTFVFPLKNVAPDLTAENFEEYTWTIKAESGYEDTADFNVLELELVNAQTGQTFSLPNEVPFTVNASAKTMDFNKSKLNNIVVYYRGYENPTINYQVDDNNWESATMSYNLERRGATHKFVIPVSTDATAKIYFTDPNGNTDNNNGDYYTATNGLNYFNTDSAREPLKATIHKPDIEYDVLDYPNLTGEASGGYGPYLYQFVYINLDDRSVFEEQWKETADNPETEFQFNQVGNYRIMLNVKDYSDNIVSDSFDVYVDNIPFAFDEFNLTQGNKVVAGQPVTIHAKTTHEQIMAWGETFSYYKITITKDGVTYFDEEIRSFNLDFRTRESIIKQQWTPYENGVYNMTISSVDFNEDYAESSYTFEVKDHKIGDADTNTEINIRDATLVQMYIARFAKEDTINKTSADTNKDYGISISDATAIQMYVTHLDHGSYVGEIIPVEKPIDPTEPTTQPETTEPETTEPVTEPITDPVNLNKVYFTNAHDWNTPLYCYYWSDENTKMTSWPGEEMTLSDEFTFGPSVYTFDVPEGATYVIFSDGSKQTVDVPYSGGTIKYYPSYDPDSNGKYPVFTW